MSLSKPRAKVSRGFTIKKGTVSKNAVSRKEARKKTLPSELPLYQETKVNMAFTLEPE